MSVHSNCGKSADLRNFLHNLSLVVYLCGNIYKIMLRDNSWASIWVLQISLNRLPGFRSNILVKIRIWEYQLAENPRICGFFCTMCHLLYICVAWCIKLCCGTTHGHSIECYRSVWTGFQGLEAIYRWKYVQYCIWEMQRNAEKRVSPNSYINPNTLKIPIMCSEHTS